MAKSINIGRFFISLLQRMHGAHRLVLPIYLSNLTSFKMFPLNLMLVPLSCISSLDLLLRLTHTNIYTVWFSVEIYWVTQCGWLWFCIKFVWEWPLKLSGNYFVIRLREINMKNWLVSENFQNEFLLIDSMIILQLTQEPRKNIPLLDYFDYRGTVPTWSSIHFSSYVSLYTQGSTVSDLNIYIALS